MLFLRPFIQSKAFAKRHRSHLQDAQGRLFVKHKQKKHKTNHDYVATVQDSTLSQEDIKKKKASTVSQSSAHLKDKSSQPRRNHILKLCIIMGMITVSAHSLSAQASLLDPIRRVFSPFLKNSESNESDENLPTSDELITEQAPLDPSITSNPVNNDQQSMTSNQPSLRNIMYAEFLLNRGRIRPALALYKKESFKQDSTSVFERALELSLLYESASQSLQFARQWQQQNPEHIPALFYVVHLALKANDYELASEVLSQILEYDPQADLSEILLGIYPSTERDQRLLLETLLALPKHDNPSLLVMQSGLMYQLKQPDIALVSINRALKIQPDNAAFIVLKSDILKELEPDRDILKYISAERKRLKNSKQLYLYEIRYLLDLGQVQEAWTLLIEAHDLFHDDEITLLAALVSIDLEKYIIADNLLSELASSPAYIDQAYYYLGISAERQHNFDRSLRFLSKVMQESLVLKAKQKIVAIQLSQEHPEQALATLDKFSQQFEIYAPDSAIMQADILQQQNKVTEALEILTNANRRFPDDTKLLFARAKLLDNTQNKTLKRQLLDRLVLIDPENPNYMLELALMLSESSNEKDIQYALTLAQSILNLPFNSSFFNQDTYISALNILAKDALSKEQYQQVIDYLESTYDIYPTLDSGIILLRAYQGTHQTEKVSSLFNDIQQRFAVGQQALSDRLQSF